jgi:FkbM family methyltransferase
MKRIVRSLVRALGFDVVRFRRDRVGRDALEDMARYLQTDRPLVFDVGANIGQSIERFRARFPRSTIHSFEPSPTTFDTLRRYAGNLDGVHLWNCALGSAPGRRMLFENSDTSMSSLLPLGESGWGDVTKETSVDVTTIDQFCRAHEIQRIDVLKSDTQGFELEVLRGAERMFGAETVGLVYCEVIFSDMYEGRASCAEIYDFLTNRGFRLVTFYDFYYQQHLAGWTDALFVHHADARSRHDASA